MTSFTESVRHQRQAACIASWSFPRPGPEPNGRFFIVTAVASHTKAQSSVGAPTRGVEPPLLTLIGKPLLALTHDRKLLETLMQVADPAHEVYAAGSEVDLASAIMARHPGVVVLDIAALATPVGQLAGRLHAQFPDVVLIVAGGADDQGGLAARITDGSVHRFLHKPVSEQRVRLFVEAAWRRHAQELTAPAAAASAPAPKTPRGARWWGACLPLAVIAAPFIWIGTHLPPPARNAPASPAASRAASCDAELDRLLAPVEPA